MKVLRLRLSSLINWLLQKALSGGPAQCRDRQCGRETKSDGRIAGAGFLRNHSRYAGICDKNNSGDAPSRTAPPGVSEQAQWKDEQSQCDKGAQWQADLPHVRDKLCRRDRLYRSCGAAAWVGGDGGGLGGFAGAVLAGSGGSGGGAAALGTGGGASVIVASGAATGAAGCGLLAGSIGCGVGTGGFRGG